METSSPQRKSCASCGSKVTRGDIDWVLSRIEQDEVFELDG